jgi:glycerol 2-dehydrogenase (NADP+)
MPAVGFGTWRIHRSQAAKAVETALRAGYRHIDTALAYGNEREVGAGIRASGVPREEIWVSGKLRNTWHKHARQCLEKSLKSLGLEYFDLYLIHWPCSRDAENPAVCYQDWDFVDTWMEMQELLDEGKVLNIGVSNFGIQQLEKLLSDPWTEVSSDLAPMKLLADCLGCARCQPDRITPLQSITQACSIQRFSRHPH